MADRTYFGGDNDRTIGVSKQNPMPVANYSDGISPFVSRFGEMFVTNQTPTVLVQFQYNNSSMDVDAASSGTGSTANASNKAEVHTGTGIGQGKLTSHDVVRYRPGHESYGKFTATFSTPEANTTQLAGMFDDDHGYAIGYNGTEFAVTLRKAGVDDFTVAKWLDPLDGTGPSKYAIQADNLNVFRITHAWLGISPVTFWVYTGYLTGWHPFAYIDLVGQQSGVIIENPNLAIRVEATRSAGSGSDLVVTTASWSGGTTISDDTLVGSRSFATKNSKSISAGVLTNILTIQSAATFQSITSHIRANMLAMSASMDGTKPGEILLYKNATLGGTPSFTNIDSNNSTMSVDVAGTTVTGGVYQWSINLGKTGNDTERLKDLDVHIHPGDTLTLAALSVNAADIIASLRWQELF